MLRVRKNDSIDTCKDGPNDNDSSFFLVEVGILKKHWIIMSFNWQWSNIKVLFNVVLGWSRIKQIYTAIIYYWLLCIVLRYWKFDSLFRTPEYLISGGGEVSRNPISYIHLINQTRDLIYCLQKSEMVLITIFNFCW